jgi:hypothetical protein
LQLSQIQLLAMYVGEIQTIVTGQIRVFFISDPQFVPLQKSSYKTEYLNGTDPLIDSSYRPPAPEAIMSLHFDPFCLSSSQENIAKF